VIGSDVSSADSIEHLARSTYDRFGACHLLFNNAGVGTAGPIWTAALDDWKWTLDKVFGTHTAMSLLFLGAKDHRIPARYLDDMRDEFARPNTETSRSVLRFYQSRKNAAAVESDQRRLPQLHALGG